ncbi:hypothetical protein GCM10017674_09960 [Streptomyces gardneri]|uniref:Uncharacterized protein n=1 Tax=Streptomyces gardneri TaxID=66892 RepID=A0A4Y3RRD4_9ACTN|nr:hypothetical protein SGA01_54690 [Streptomyces gardneri]GHG85785.1 hypothetical protein GCM10017674_09960 [Streptomyces gardneri]
MRRSGLTLGVRADGRSSLTLGVRADGRSSLTLGVRACGRDGPAFTSRTASVHVSTSHAFSGGFPAASCRFPAIFRRLKVSSRHGDRRSSPSISQE